MYKYTGQCICKHDQSLILIYDRTLILKQRKNFPYSYFSERHPRARFCKRLRSLLVVLKNIKKFNFLKSRLKSRLNKH
jgi:hypothetical protein